LVAGPKKCKSNVKWEVSRLSRNKKREYLKDKIIELESNSKNKNIREMYKTINEYIKGYQSRNNLVKCDMVKLFADPHRILNRWKNSFC
jgi:glucan phosphorylase